MTEFVVVGGLPEPTGGVTTFLKRLFLRDHEKIAIFVDCYPGQKIELPGSLSRKIVNVGTPARLIGWFWRNRQKTSHRKVFFNFSGAKALLLMLLLPKGKGTQFQILLHHGDLHVDGAMLRLICKLTAKRIDLAYAMNDSHTRFYIGVGVPSHKIVPVKSYVPVQRACVPDQRANDFMQGLRKQFGKVFVASGYPTPIYNLDWTLDIFRKPEFCSSALVIFVYGPESLNPQKKKIQEAARDLSNVFFFSDQDEDFFNSILQQCDCYLRPTSKDSFGIAVADAINFNTDVIASNVCERWAGTYLFNIDDMHEGFLSTINAYLSMNQDKIDRSAIVSPFFNLK